MTPKPEPAIAVRATYAVRRFGHSDVHVYHDSPGPYVCEGCSRSKGRDAVARTADAMLGHLRTHWDRVPTEVLTRLQYQAQWERERGVA